VLNAILLETTGPFRVLKYSGNRGRVELASVFEERDSEAVLAGVSLEGKTLGGSVRMAGPNEQFEAPQFRFQPLLPVYLGVDGEIVQDTSSLPFVRQVGWAITEHVVWIDFKDVAVDPGSPGENPYPDLEDHQCSPIVLRTGFTFTVERDRQSLFLQPITVEVGAFLKLEERAGLLEVRATLTM
jgi:hypothetical protein